MLYEVNMSGPKGNNDACVESCEFSLSNQHCLRGGGGGECYILFGVTEEQQESEIYTIMLVLLLLLGGIVVLNERKLDL